MPINSVTNQLLNDKLQGLLLPPENSMTHWSFILSLIIISLLLIALTVWLYHQHKQKPVIIALIRLKHLKQQKRRDQSTPSDLQATALEIAQILRQGLEVTRLDNYQSKQKTSWEIFKSSLNNACYSTNPNVMELKQIFTEAEHWLQKAIRPMSNNK